MKKRIVYVLLGVIGVLAAAFFIYLTWTKSHSPAADGTHKKDGLEIEVKYCRPSKKGRLIFGEATAGALQPYGKYWRVGANEATVFEINKDVLVSTVEGVDGTELKAGKYNLYAYPDK